MYGLRQRKPNKEVTVVKGNVDKLYKLNPIKIEWINFFGRMQKPLTLVTLSFLKFQFIAMFRTREACIKYFSLLIDCRCIYLNFRLNLRCAFNLHIKSNSAV